jgi:hypothetical protein
MLRVILSQKAIAGSALSAYFDGASEVSVKRVELSSSYHWRRHTGGPFSLSLYMCHFRFVPLGRQ